MQIIFFTCVLCLGLAIYSGYRIVSETHLHRDEPSRVPGMAKNLHRDSIASFDQAHYGLKIARPEPRPAREP